MAQKRHSAIGKYYTYYYASNYIAKYDKSNITKILEHQHIENLIHAVKKHSIGTNMSKKQLKLLEDEYNSRFNSANATMDKIITLAKKHDINARKALENWIRQIKPKLSEEAVDDIIDNLEINPSTGAPYYKGVKFQDSKEKNAAIFEKWNLGNATLYRKRNILFFHIKNAIEVLETNFDKSIVEQYIKDLKEIQKQIRTVNGKYLSEVELKALPYSLNKILISTEGDLAEKAYNLLYNIKGALNGIASLNQDLSWMYAESMGQIVASGAYITAAENLQDYIQKQLTLWNKKSSQGAQSTRRVTNSRGHGGIQFGLESWNFDQKLLKAEYEKNKKGYVRKIKDGKFSLTPIGNIRQGKQDITLEVEVNNKKRNIGASVKNYSLSGSGAIDLQTTGSLLQYLEGAEAITNHITEHMLNIFAWHPEKEDGVNYGSIMRNFRKEAVLLLKGQLLYSALSGRFQMKSGQHADILFVYDKSSKNETRVKLYSIRDLTISLLEDKNKLMDMVKLTPSLSQSTILFDNKWETNKKSPRDYKLIGDARTRYTKVLLEARSKSIGVALAKNILQTYKL